MGVKSSATLKNNHYVDNKDNSFDKNHLEQWRWHNNLDFTISEIQSSIQ